jgi:putative PIN family toxin of toxin-antitoxin system
MRVLLDTNVLANGIAGRVIDAKSPPARIWQCWRAGEFDVLLSPQVREELQRVLILPWFASRLSDSDRSLALAELGAFSEIVEIDVFVSGVTSHWQDDLVLAAAASGGADFLVTGDVKFRRTGEYHGVKIRTPAEFLQELDPQSH